MLGRAECFEADTSSVEENDDVYLSNSGFIIVAHSAYFPQIHSFFSLLLIKVVLNKEILKNDILSSISFMYILHLLKHVTRTC